MQDVAEAAKQNPQQAMCALTLLFPLVCACCQDSLVKSGSGDVVPGISRLH
jgi:hypothetical protein